MNLNKKYIRALGIDDAPIQEKTLLLFILTRLNRLEVVAHSYVDKDGKDSTEKILEILKLEKIKNQTHVIFINGISVAGFNIIDIDKISQEIKIPIIVVTENEPHPDEITKALQKFPDKLKIWEKLKKKYYVCKTKYGNVFYQNYNIDEKEACNLIKKFAIYSKIPEPLRLAHIIGRGIIDKISKGI